MSSTFSSQNTTSTSNSTPGNLELHIPATQSRATIKHLDQDASIVGGVSLGTLSAFTSTFIENCFPSINSFPALTGEAR